MTPNEDFLKEYRAIQKEQQVLEKRKEKMFKKLKEGQEKCPHKRCEGGFLHTECLDCGLTN